MVEEFVTGYSPTPTKPKQKPNNRLTFPQALEQVIKGKKITKLEWEDEGTYLYLSDEYLKIHHSDGRDTALIVSNGDMIGMDWTIKE